MRNRSIIINNPNNVTNIHWIANKMTHSKKVMIFPLFHMNHCLILKNKMPK